MPLAFLGVGFPFNLVIGLGGGYILTDGDTPPSSPEQCNIINLLPLYIPGYNIGEARRLGFCFAGAANYLYIVD